MWVGKSFVAPDGIPKLVEAIHKMSQSKQDQEAQELYHEGAKKGRPLSRQRGEPMSQ